MLRTVLQMLATTPVQWEVQESSVSYLTNFSWRDQVHGLTYQQKLRALRRIYRLARAIHGRRHERLPVIRATFLLQLRILRRRRGNIRRAHVRALRRRLLDLLRE